jgi:adenine-specific DNA-methyltransferase
MTTNTKLPLHTTDRAEANFAALAALFPNAVTETIDKSGAVVRAIDADVLTQEINSRVVSGKEERYQFTWPDKRKSVLAANAPIAATLRPCRGESVDFDNTENLYIEGDNLDVLKLLQETYLNRVKMIYIDPPYNTGNDFVYADDFAEDAGECLSRDGQYDEDGNRMVKNLDSNGRFHTDRLNMIYPRLRLARDLLRDDGVIFVSVDYNENFNMRKILDEVFGAMNFVGEIYWESKTKSQNTSTAYNKLQPKAEMILVYTKQSKRRFNLIAKDSKNYPFSDEQGQYREYPLEVMNAAGIRGRESMIFDITDGVSIVSPPAGKQWKLGQVQVSAYKNDKNLFIRDGKVIIKMRPEFERSESTEPF